MKSEFQPYASHVGRLGIVGGWRACQSATPSTTVECDLISVVIQNPVPGMGM